MYHWVEHTSEAELRIEAATPEGIFEDALKALGELLGDPDAEAVPVTRHLDLTAPDSAALLAAWMDELVFLAETEGLVAPEADALDLDDGRLSATVRVRPGSPRSLVKGTTYHRLAFEETSEGGFLASVVLDV